ncbi:MAG: NAD(P)/FAD-dependent oxidoreductase [Microbacteriaceae bacterium]|nr:NAD(P)/FAD-dependent oxidoreductase [Microbacteriaceae bacterium]
MTGRAGRPFRVAIVGSGFGGLAMAVKLSRRTDADFVVFEQAADLGGTWRDNQYPGCEVDIHSHIYSFSFLRHDWPRTHATQPELYAYANRVVDRFGLRDRIRLGTGVVEARWVEAEDGYDVVTTDGRTERFDAVVSAVGLLNVPRYPEWPGLESFQGVRFHTSRWEPQHDLAGKRVAVVGTGSTAIQVVPALAPLVGELTVYQREPGWIEPKSERAFTPFERWLYGRVPLAQRAHRYALWAKANRRFKGYDKGSRMQERMRDVCTAFIERTVRDPETRAALIPDYAWGCKRPIVATTYYDAFNRGNVRLVPHAVVAATPTGLVDAAGVERPVDVLVLSTGFQPQRFLANLEVVGEGGLRLHEAWEERASAFLGVTVPGFPNFFILYGPNTNGGTSIIAQLERQAELAVAAIRRLTRRRGSRVRTDPAATRAYVAWIDRELATRASAKNSGCHNYFTDERGAVVTEWPRTHLVYWWLTRTWRRRGLRYS